MSFYYFLIFVAKKNTTFEHISQLSEVLKCINPNPLAILAKNIPESAGVSWPSGLAYRTQVLVLAA